MKLMFLNLVVPQFAPDSHFTSEGESLPLEALVVQEAVLQNLSLVTAESCTGGLVVSRLTDVNGASQVVHGGFVTYHNEFKINLAAQVGLGDKMESALFHHGAVSPEVAELMAMSAAKVYKIRHPDRAVLAVSTTGIAGPGGGVPAKPVGTCCFAISDGEKILQQETFTARQGLARDQLKLLFSQKALDLLRRQLIS